MQQTLFSLLVLSILWSCKIKKDTSVLSLATDKQLVFLDSTAAAQAIVTDEIDHFFSLVGSLEMSIQMQKNYPSHAARTAILSDYVNFLQRDVSNFTEDEKIWVSAVFEDVYEKIKKVSPALFPTNIELIKSPMRHYGPSVYYTRENMIVIPENVLQEKNRPAFFRTMVHEIFHILSRYNPELRHKLYALIGFTPMDETLRFPVALQNRLLYNPDGVNMAYEMSLKQADGSIVQAIPVIYTSKDTYDVKAGGFFGHVEFSMFEIEKNGNTAVVKAKDNGFPTLNMGEQVDFFRQISDNTNYIIHPDEIISENFVAVVMEEDVSENNRFSKEGLDLLHNVRSILNAQ